NSRGWVTHLRTVAADGTTVLRDQAMTYDDAGNMLTSAASTDQVTYSYDAAGRIAAEQRRGADVGDLAYSYDGDWNLTQIGGRPLGYDGAMRLTTDGSWTHYAYDVGGRPTSRSNDTVAEQLAYDSLGRLVRVDRSGPAPSRVDLEYNDAGLLRR